MNYVELSAEDRTLLQAAVDAAERLYVRGVQEVAAAVRTADGAVFTAIHFETSTGFATVCGEVAAISCMVASGRRDADTIVAVWRDPDGRHFVLPPCGRCREVISDFNPAAWVIVTTLPDHWAVDAIAHVAKLRVSELLPLRSHQLKLPSE